MVMLLLLLFLLLLLLLLRNIFPMTNCFFAPNKVDFFLLQSTVQLLVLQSTSTVTRFHREHRGLVV